MLEIYIRLLGPFPPHLHREEANRLLLIRKGYVITKYTFSCFQRHIINKITLKLLYVKTSVYFKILINITNLVYPSWLELRLYNSSTALPILWAYDCSPRCVYYLLLPSVARGVWGGGAGRPPGSASKDHIMFWYSLTFAIGYTKSSHAKHDLLLKHVSHGLIKL